MVSHENDRLLKWIKFEFNEKSMYSKNDTDQRSISQVIYLRILNYIFISLL